MSRRKPHFGFPLLVKELTELANRKRTYVVRFLYAAGLFIGGMVAIYDTVGADGGDLQIGVGGDIFRDLVQLQFALILLFLPATAAGALTIEKERDSLALLLLTTMPPWSILLQKFFSRLTPMVSFLLLAFPLLAVAYSYGGVATDELEASIILLLLFAAEVCAVSLMCSAYCRTTPEALISTYIALLILYILPPFWPPHLFSYLRSSQLGAYPVALGGVSLVGGLIAVSLFLARVFLQSRAFVPPRNVLLQAFQSLDRLYVRMNRITGGVVLVNDTASLPEEHPVAWRETAKKSLGTFRYLFRVCTLLELPILFVGTTINISAVRSHSAMTALLYILWGIAAVMICVHASGVITAERSRQTLDVLLSTPLTGAEILRQKMAGVNRLIAVLWLPFGTIFAFQLWFRGFDFGYLLGSVGAALIFLPLMAWMSLAVGLRIRATMKAILVSAGIVVGVCVLPFFLSSLLSALFGPGEELLGRVLEFFSPVRVIGLLEVRGVVHDRTEEWVFWFSLLALPLYAAVLRWVRRDCLRHADQLLQRVAGETPADESNEFAAGSDLSSGSTSLQAVEAV